MPKERPSKPFRVEPGVWYRPTGHFEVFLYFRGRDIFVGTFETIQDAVDARDRRRAELEAGRPIVKVADGRVLLTDFAERIYFPQTAGLRRRQRHGRRAHATTPTSAAFKDVRLATSPTSASAISLQARDRRPTRARRGAKLYVPRPFSKKRRSVDSSRRTPPPGSEAPAEEADPGAVPTYEDAVRVVEAITHPVARMLAETLLYAGTRVNEALALRWDDVDFDEKTFFVSRSIDQVTGELVSPKTASGVRLVELPDALVDRLRAYRERQLAGEVTRSDPWVFPAKTDRTDGRPPVLHDRNFAQRYWEKALTSVGCRGSPALPYDTSTARFS